MNDSKALDLVLCILLDLLHERMRESGFAELGEVFENGGLPWLVARYVLCPAILQIKRPRVIDTIEKHQGCGAVRIKPDLVRRERDGLIGGRKALIEVMSEDEVISQTANPPDDKLQVVLPKRIAIICLDKR